MPATGKESNRQLLIAIHDMLEGVEQRGEMDQAVLDWNAPTGPWDGAAPMKLQVRPDAGYVRIVSAQITAGGGGGGCTERTLYLCEVGQVPANAKVTSTAQAIADQLNVVLDVPRPILANASGEIDVYVVPDLGTTEGILYLDVESA